MAITKTFENDKIEVVRRWNVQVRKATVIKEDGVVLTDAYHRTIYKIGDNLNGVEDETVVKSLSSSLWTPAVSASYSDFQTSASLGL